MAQPLIVIACALHAEARPLRRRLTGRSDVRLIVTGMGPVRAAAELADLLNVEHPALVIAAGFAGALNPDLSCAQVIRPATVIEAATGISFGRPALTADPTGPADLTLVTVDRPALTPQARADLRRRFGADAVDMETAAIARLCVERGIPWRTVRIITDTVDQVLPADLARLVDSRGRSRPLAAAAVLLCRPARLRAMLALARQARRCAARLARTLTDQL